ncbi:MAG: hypothetical protein Q8K99_06070 [Actinomycetota bacterium]|nr:hypothetical protein [Actinomycetota bacterium]
MGNSAKTRTRSSRSAPARPTRSATAMRMLDPAPTREIAFAAFAATVSFYIVFGYTKPLPLLFAPIVAGAVAGLIVRIPVWAAVCGAAGGLIGVLLALATTSVDAFVRLANTMPQYANPDVLVSYVYQDFLYGLATSNPLNPGGVSGAGTALVLLVGVIAAAAVAFGVRFGLASLPGMPRTEQYVGHGVVALLGVLLVYTLSVGTPAFHTYLAEEPVSGTYAYDAVVYQNTHLLMTRGSGYYQALLDSAAGDSRVAENNWVRDGKFYGWVNTPTLAREPAAFYLWRVAAPNGSTGVFYLALVASLAAMAAVYWGLLGQAPRAAILGPVILLPMLELLASWQNIFFPDYWAGLALLASVGFLLRKNLLVAGAFALLAALFRETLVFWPMILLAGAAWRRKELAGGWRTVGVLAGYVALFAAAYALHYVNAARLIAPEAMVSASFIARLQQSWAQTFAGKFLAPASYMMWPYGAFRIPGALYMFTGTAGFALALKDSPLARWTATAHAAFWIVFYLTIGAASSYWGQQTMPFYLLGTVLLVAWAGGAMEPVAIKPRA